MKKLLSFIAPFLLCTSIYAQDYPINSDGDIEFIEVVETPLKKTNLFSNAKEWIAKTFGDYKSVVQFEDNDNYKLIVKGFSDIDYNSPTVEVNGYVGMSTKEKLSFTIIIECKDDKYRYTINNVLVHQIINVLGTTVNNKPFSPLIHIKNISKYKNNQETLKVVDTSKMKKKEVAEHNSKIFDCEKHINEEQNFYEQEHQILLSLCASLKKAMALNANF